jgi:hypothetical protein
MVLPEYYVGVIINMKFSDRTTEMSALKLLCCGNSYGICVE